MRLSLYTTRSRILAVLLAALLALSVRASAQELYAGIDGHVKDPTGALVAKAAVEVTSPELIGFKKMETDSGGYFRFVNLPPGNYTLTVTATGFRTFKQTGIALAVGRLPTVDITLQVGRVTEMVEVSAATPLVDLATTKVQAVIGEDVLQNAPKGRSYQSLIQFAPGARAEPMQGGTGGAAARNNNLGYQIDGAGNAENSYLVEGQETANPQFGVAGLDVPMEFIQEVQVKTSGFEAEHGGAMGGVVNVIQKRGSNTWHGGIYTSYESSAADAAPDRVLRKNPDIAASSSLRLDQPAQYWQPKQDHYRYLYPGFDVGGPFVKDRLWAFLSFVPSIENVRRTVNFAQTAPVPGPTSFNGQRITYYSLARLDLMATQKIRLFGAWQNNYQRVTGATLLPYGGNGATGAGQGQPWPDDVFGTTNVIAGANVQNYNNSIGYVRPMVVYNTGADITISPMLVATTRFGYYYQDYQDRGLPIGTRYLYADTNYPYAVGNVTVTPTLAALNGSVLQNVPGYQSMGPAGASLVQTGGWANIGVNYAVEFDKYKRYSFSQDFSYLKKFAGTHNFKVGYQFHKLTNDVSNGYNSSLSYVALGVQYVPNAAPGIANCAAIVTQNLANGWTAGGPTGTALGSQCQGLWGTVNMRDLGTTGIVGSWNHGLYLQDAWTVSNRLTLNLGVRFDKEDLPSYNAGFKGISFDWTQKVAPRLGASFDVLGNRKVKAYFSYGWFYDIMKYELPRGSFGGDWWHDCVYALDTLNFSAILPQRNSAGHYCPASGGTVGVLPAGLRFIENYDYRMPSNDPTQLGALGPLGLVDPNLQPTKQHEYVAGLDWEISNNVVFDARYSRKRLDRTIEDAGVIVSGGEAYYITNPGFGADEFPPQYQCVGCPRNPKAVRNYDGLEFRLTKRGGAKWFGSLSYSYSRLYGNYSGLTATDISDGGAGRSSPDVSRGFDEPHMQFDSHGKVINGPLATDRPHTFKAYGYYALKWKKMETTFGAFQQLYSGTPLSSYISVWGAPVFVEGRGKFVDVTRDAATGNWALNAVSARRTPLFSQTDFNLEHHLSVSKTNENMKLGFGMNIYNLFNQHSPIWYNQNLIRTGSIQPFSCSASGNMCPIDPSTNTVYDYLTVDYKRLLGGYDYVASANSGARILNSLYGKPYGWQDARSFRFTVKFLF